MRMTFLGTGTAWSKAPGNYNNNVLVSTADQRWLIDCGTTAPLALHHMGLSVADFDGVLITHLHGDHVFGLEETGFYNYFALGRKVKLWLPELLLTRYSGIDGEDLWENCLRGPMGTVQMLDGSPREVGLHDYFDVELLVANQPTLIHGTKVEIIAVDHVPSKPSFGLILNDTVAYTSDCTFSLERISRLLDAGVTTLFHDAYFGPPFAGRVHTSVEELLTLPRDLAECLVLMHYNDDASAEERQRVIDAGFRLAIKGEAHDFSAVSSAEP